MVPLLFGDSADAVHKIERLLEVGKTVFAVEMMFVDNAPAGNTIVQSLKFSAGERWHSATTGYALFFQRVLS